MSDNRHDRHLSKLVMHLTRSFNSDSYNGRCLTELFCWLWERSCFCSAFNAVGVCSSFSSGAFQEEFDLDVDGNGLNFQLVNFFVGLKDREVASE